MKKFSDIFKVSVLSLIFSIICISLLCFTLLVDAVFNLNVYFILSLRIFLILQFFLALIISIVAGFYSVIIKKELFGLIVMVFGGFIFIIAVFMVFVQLVFLGFIPIYESPPNIEATIRDLYYSPALCEEGNTWFITIEFENKENYTVTGFNKPHFISDKYITHNCYAFNDYVYPYTTANITFSSWDVGSVCTALAFDEKPVFFEFSYSYDTFSTSYVKLRIPEYFFID